MSEIRSGYQSRIDALKEEITQLSRKIRLVALFRFLVFVCSGLAFFDVAGFGDAFRWTAGPVLLVLFFVLVRWNRNLDLRRKASRARQQICEGELQSLEGHDASWHAGTSHHDPRHAYAADLDLVGEHSIYRRLCRAWLEPGQAALAGRLMNWSSNHEEITRRQQAVRELGPMLDWRLDVGVKALLASERPPDFDALRSWGCEGNTHQLKGIFRFLHLAIPAWATLVIVFQSVGMLSEIQFAVGILLPLAFVGRHLSKTQAVSEQLGRRFKGLSSVSGLFNHLASHAFESEVMVGLQQEGKGADQAFRSLSAITNAFDNRNNVVVAVVLNMLLGWDFWCLKRLEAWHKQYGVSIPGWVDTLAELEVNCSLAAFAFNHDRAVWPKFSDKLSIQSENLGHPLISPDVRVDNHFQLDERGFAIITGANMAGKSTFLRTLGVNLVLAMSGAPVVATEFVFKSVPLFTSMRTTDALEEQASYFYAELRRLQEVIEVLEAGQPRFVILDEILKGTNSRDKAEGSRKFLEKLTKLPATGVVATHDLSLCEITAEYPQIRNLCFDVEIGEDDLTFDYVLRDGICSNMNATFLMDKMGITR